MSHDNEDGFRISPFSSDADGDNYESPETEPEPEWMPPPPTRDGGPLVFHPTTEINDTNRRLEHKYEVVELDEEVVWNERLHCCNGLFPLDHVATAMNIIALVSRHITTKGSLPLCSKYSKIKAFNIWEMSNEITFFRLVTIMKAIGVIGLSLASYWIHTSTHGVIGARSLRHLLVTSILLLLIGAIPIGGLLILCGSGGLYYKFAKTKRLDSDQGPRISRKVDVTYHSLLYLCSLLSLVYFITSTVSFSHIALLDGVYNIKSWAELSKTHPQFHCLLEQRLNCSIKCSTSQRATRFNNCPGAFCVEFCRVNLSVPFEQSSVHPICRPCKEKGSYMISFFAQCRQFELDISANVTAAGPVNHTDSEMGDNREKINQNMRLVDDVDDDVDDCDFDERDYDGEDINRARYECEPDENVAGGAATTHVDDGKSVAEPENCIDVAARDLIRTGMYPIILASTYMIAVIGLNLATCYRLCYL